ncbi:hypothetical protein V5O48_003093 [Marasmius crinis-equi]|uniref:HAT C-terminal dimerisation domain-containing protein n=1 Tax=Marasmius crinis-equi TaxID=585013 RepID=A0ABR3FTV6_9AGAR
MPPYLKYKPSAPSPYEIRLAHGGQGITPQVIKNYMMTLKRHSEDTHSFETRREDFKALLCKWLASADRTVANTQSLSFRELFGPEIPNQDELLSMAEDMALNIVRDTQRAVNRIALSIHVSPLSKPRSVSAEVVVSILVHYSSSAGSMEERVLGLRSVKAELKSISDFVWITMEKYDLPGKLYAIIVDDTKQSDQLVEDIEQRLLSKGNKFAAKLSRLHCLHHTVRRAAAEFLQSSKSTLGNSRPYDTEAMLGVLDKLRHIIRYITSRPTDEWRQEANILPHNLRSLVLILDNEVNPWPTIGRMIGRALYLRPTIESFLRTHPAIKSYGLSDLEWQQLAFVSTVLNHFVTTMDRMVLGRSHHGRIGPATLPHLMNVPYCELLDVIRETLREVSQANSSFASFRNALMVSYDILQANYCSPLYVISAWFDPQTRLNSAVFGSEIERESVTAADAHLQNLLREAYPAPHNYLQAVHQLTLYQALPPIEDSEVDPVEWWNLRKGEFPLLYPIAMGALSVPGTVTAAERHALLFHETQITLRQSSVWGSERDQIIETMTVIKHDQTMQ